MDDKAGVGEINECQKWNKQTYTLKLSTIRYWYETWQENSSFRYFLFMNEKLAEYALYYSINIDTGHALLDVFGVVQQRQIPTI